MTHGVFDTVGCSSGVALVNALNASVLPLGSTELSDMAPTLSITGHPPTGSTG